MSVHCTDPSHETSVSQSLWRRRTVLRLYKPLLNRIKLARERVSDLIGL